MTEIDPSAELALAVELADVADGIAAARFGASDLVVDVKPNGSPTTDVDRAIEAAVVEVLRRRRPSVRIVGEEDGPAYAGEPTYWAIDPIDGTAAFIAGESGWGFTACLVADGEPVVGVGSSIALGQRWWAARGQGAFVRPLPGGTTARLRVSTGESLADAAIGWWDGWGAAATGRPSPRLDRAVQTLTSRAASVARTGRAAISVASGELDAAVMWLVDDAPWGQALFVLLVLEAGGMATDWTGAPDLGAGRKVFSNGRLHDQLLGSLTAEPEYRSTSTEV